MTRTTLVVDQLWTPETAKAEALRQHPDCSYAEWENGLDYFLQPTIVVKLWRNEECWANDDPPRHIVGGFYR